MAEMNLPTTPARAAHGRGISVGCTDAPLLDAFMRLLRLLDSPQHIVVLAPLIVREIFYLLLMGDQGDHLRRVALGQGEPGIVQALHWLKYNFAAPLRIEEIARQVHMSPSAFHYSFKALTAMTPLQYQKQLRLQEARRLLLGDDIDAATAGLRVGCESASQFNREYHRLFGDPPLVWRPAATSRGCAARDKSTATRFDKGLSKGQSAMIWLLCHCPTKKKSRRFKTASRPELKFIWPTRSTNKQHNVHIASGRPAILAFLESLPHDKVYVNVVRAFEDGSGVEHRDKKPLF